MSNTKPSRYHKECAGCRRPADEIGISRVNTAATTNTVQTTTPAASYRTLANPAPLGLAGFAFTTFLLGLINLQTQQVKIPNVVIGPAIAYGGITQFCAGMWEMAIGNTFGATALASYGAFWVSYAIILIPGFGVSEAYPNPAELSHAMGFFMMGFFVFTVLQLSRAGGSFALLAAFNAWYIMYAGIADSKNSFLIAPLFHLPWGTHGPRAEDIQNELGQGRI